MRVSDTVSWHKLCAIRIIILSLGETEWNEVTGKGEKLKIQMVIYRMNESDMKINNSAF